MRQNVNMCPVHDILFFPYGNFLRVCGSNVVSTLFNYDDFE